MKNEIMMYSGSYFDFNSPETSTYTIEDIAHALSNINRFTGHTRVPYSVAEHCVRGSFWIDPEFALEFLLHDAAESMLGDVATPLKMMLPDYKAIEQRVEMAIAEKFGTSFPMLPQVKAVDTRMLKTEVINLMPKAAQEWDCLRGIEPFPVIIHSWSPGFAKRAFIDRFYELTKGK